MNYDLIPEHMHGVVKRYVEDGIEPGHFLEAVLTNNLARAFGSADAVNKACMADWVHFAMWELPAHCWGSVKKYDNWIAMGGLNGRKK